MTTVKPALVKETLVHSIRYTTICENDCSEPLTRWYALDDFSGSRSSEFYYRGIIICPCVGEKSLLLMERISWFFCKVSLTLHYRVFLRRVKILQNLIGCPKYTKYHCSLTRTQSSNTYETVHILHLHISMSTAMQTTYLHRSSVHL